MWPVRALSWNYLIFLTDMENNEFMSEYGQEAQPDEFGVMPVSAETVDGGDPAEKTVGKECMSFRREWLDAVRILPREVQGEVFAAIIEYGLTGWTTGPLKPVTRAMLAMVKGHIDLCRTRSVSGKKGGRPAKDRDLQQSNVYQHKETYINNQKPNENQSKTKPKPNRNQTETKPNQTKTKPKPNLTKPEPNPNHSFSNNINNNIILSPKVDNISSNSNELEASRPARIREGEALPLERIRQMWNDTCPSFPKLLKLSDARKNKIRIRLQEMGGGEKGLEVMQEIFRRLEGSSFLKGDNKRGWKASFDWVFENDKNWVKVWEGNYGGHDGNGGPSSSFTSDNVNDIWN